MALITWSDKYCVSISCIYIKKKKLAELVNQSLEAGTHSYNFDASNLTSGVYIYSLQTDAGVVSNKMTLLK